MSLQQPRRGRVLLLAAALLVAACSTPPPQPESMRDPQANFAAYRTYGWQPVPQVLSTNAFVPPGGREAGVKPPTFGTPRRAAADAATAVATDAGKSLRAIPGSA